MYSKWYKELTPLIEQNLSTRAMAKELGIAQTTLLYRLKVCSLKLGYTCLCCGKALSKNNTHFCSEAHKRNFYKDNNVYPNDLTTKNQKGRQRRLELINYLGGECQHCGYKKNAAALSFHHKDAADKLFKLDMRSCSNRALDNLYVEVNKCLLLCANCHSELHHPECTVTI